MYETLSVNGNGDLHFVDGHGGAVSSTWIVLKSGFPFEGQFTQILITILLVRPGNYQGVGDVWPGDIVPFGATLNGLRVVAPALALHYVSADASGVSRADVDAGDLAILAQNLGRVPCWGLVAEVGQNCGLWYTDYDADTVAIDMGDVSMLSYELAQPNCGASKADSAEPGAILAWFGMRHTGRTLKKGKFLVPEVELFDVLQMQRAIADPYGYRVVIRGESESWSLIKQLFR
jgi:hypothetical protein